MGEYDDAVEYELATLRDQLAGHAVKIGEAFGRRLDYSIKSVKLVEKILGEIHREYSRTKDDSGLSGIAIEFGATSLRFWSNTLAEEPGSEIIPKLATIHSRTIGMGVPYFHTHGVRSEYSTGQETTSG